MAKVFWPNDISKARKIQDALLKRVKIRPLKKIPKSIAGVDAAFLNDSVIATATLYSYPEMMHIQDTSSTEKIRLPYIPGFLSFREGSAIMRAVSKLKIKPGVILFDGQGIAHPRGLGIASHIGVILNIPTIGCAKTRLVGEFDEPSMEKGNWTYLYYKGRRVGAVLRTRDYVKPVFVSPGHLTDIHSSIEIVTRCVSGYRIPEPLRRADQISKRLKQMLHK